MKRKVGILGGTFDPPHFGHLLIAQEVLETCQLDEVWFIPTKIPPHKNTKPYFSDEQRIELVERAIRGNAFFKLNLIEFERSGRSYTIDTVKELKNRNPDDEYFFIIGGDMIDYLPKWKSIDELLTIVTFVGVKRPGYHSRTTFTDKVIEVDVPQLDISSTSIRKRIAANRSIRYLMPEEVVTFIKGIKDE